MRNDNINEDESDENFISDEPTSEISLCSEMALVSCKKKVR